MFHVNPNMVFFGYLVLITALCPICERLSNHTSHH
jgi:hypothetical protein